MKKLLYIDIPFLGYEAGDKNRSKFLYKSLLEQYETDILLIQNKISKQEILLLNEYKNSVYFIKNQEQKFYKSSSIFSFNKKNLTYFKTLLLNNSYDYVFFRFSSCAQLAKLTKKISPLSHIIIDVDMVLSNIASLSWQNNKCFSNRYYFLETLKLHYFQKKFFKNNYTFLYTNKNELEFVKNSYLKGENKNHFILPNVINHLEDSKTNIKIEKTILFYGVLNSSANLCAYLYLINDIYPLIKNFLLENKIKILVLGKNKTSIHQNPPLNIEILGEVPSILPYIKQALFVIFPLKIAAGTLTRILEVAALKKAILATPKAANGLNLDDKIFISNTKEEFAEKIIFLVKNKKTKQNYEKKAYDFVCTQYNQEHIKNKLFLIINNINYKLVHLTRRFTPVSWGGTENVILGISEALKNKGFNFKILTSKILSSKTNEIISQIKIKRFDYFYPYFFLSKDNKKHLDLIGGNIFSFSLLKYLFFSKNIDLIHLHTAKRFASIARTICLLKNIPYLITIHGGLYNIHEEEKNTNESRSKNSFEWGKILGLLFGSRRVYKDAKAIITLNKKEYLLLKKKYPNKTIYLLPNSIDVKKFTIKTTSSFKEEFNLPKNSFIFLISARIDKQKNHLLVLKAFNILILKNYNIHLLILGNITDYIYYDLLQTYIKTKNLQKHLTFISTLKAEDQNLIKAYKASNALILASRHEPFGIVGLEAWASELPLIISDNAGMCNIINDKKTALIFKNNDILSLLKNMILLYSNDFLYKYLIKNAKQEVIKYDNELINEKIANIYKTCIKNNNL